MTRLSFFAFIIVTSAYCLLAYIPFTYQWVISFNLVSWVPVFVKFHPYLYWLVLVMVAVTLSCDLKRECTRRLAAGFLLFQALLGVGLLLHPVLSGIRNEGISLIWSMVWLFPLIWLASIDYAAKVKEIKWGPVADHDRQVLLAALLTAVFLSALYTSLFYIHFFTDRNVQLRASEQLYAVGWSTVSHLCLFVLLFGALKLINSFSRIFRRGARVEFLLCHILGAVLSAVIIRKVVLPAIAFNNRLADLFSAVAGFSIAVFLLGLSIRLHRRDETPLTRGLDLAMTPLTLPGFSSIAGWILWGTLVTLFAWGVPIAVAMSDWDFLLQKLSAVAVWPISFAAFSRLTSRVRNKNYRLAFVFLIAALIVSALKVIHSRSGVPFSNRSGLDVSAALERYSAYDTSFRAVRDILSESTDDGSLYEYLRSYTNILPSTRVEPVEISLVDDLKRAQGNRPDIFIFVIDSLRRDYLSPYNTAVGFTPNIERFAGESIVMENAFTRYGGTALSEPAIWAGAMLLHKQYVLPFYPMNSLQKLLDTDGYQSFIGVDPILSAILRPSESIVELDKRPDGHNFDFCWSLKELEKKLEERREAAPVFAYLQPWNIHMHVIAAERRTVPPGEEHPGFWAPYASRLKYMDSCFGEFVNYLKARGLYDNSIVIVTSDHGDSLGEDGRWGHSYWMYPEIVRVPLIIHLPASLKSTALWDSKAEAFSTDITPSLYYLLGHKPIVKNHLFGRPLFTASQSERAEYVQDSYVVASSYGAVYGVVSGNGRLLFLADGVKDRDYFFDLGEDPKSRLNHFTAAERSEQRQLIRKFIDSLLEFYKLNEKPQTGGAFDMGWQGRTPGEK